MEILDLIGANNVWEVVALDLIAGRLNPVLSPISEKDLLILGGSGSGHTKDAFLFNVKKKKERLLQQDIGQDLYTDSPAVLQ